jgi:hypothetical protein
MATEEKKIDLQSAMEVYQRMATPGAPHRLLALLAGSWSSEHKYWMEPDQPPTESTGNSEQMMILDGRFLQQEFSGEMMGSPFSGFGFLGYDNNTQKYVSTWLDNMGTGIYFFEGSAGADGRSIVQSCKYDDPVQGLKEWRSVTRLVDDNTYAVEMYSTDQSGKETKVMEGTYTRKVKG